MAQKYNKKIISVNHKERSTVDKLKNKEIVMIIVNFVSLLFIVLYSIFRIGGSVATVFASIMFVTIICNLLYYATIKNKGGYVLILLTTALYLINIVSNYLVGLSVFKNTTSFIGTIALALIPLLAIIVCLPLNIHKKWAIAETTKSSYFLTKRLVAGIALVGLIVFIVVAIITFASVTAINTNVVNLSSLLIFLGFALFSIFIRLIKFNKGLLPNKKIFVSVAMILVTISTLEYAVIEGVAHSDARRNSADFDHAFGKIDNSELKKPRIVAYNYADEFLGVVTNEYSIIRDTEYYVGAEGTEKGVRLKYDVYFPTFGGAKRAVLLNLHGSGGDKDIGNYAHRNKYFASRGYVVYDLQFGDFNEKDINFNWDIRKSTTMIYHIEKFFAYAIANNEIGADFNNTFLTGVSMGGGLVSKLGYAYIDELKELGVNVKGIIPVYPGYAKNDVGIDNYLNYVTNESVPCLLVMSLSDVVVYRNVVDYTREAYKNAKNNAFACIGITFSGHGSDNLAVGRFNQAYMYYAERFMAILMK